MKGDGYMLADARQKLEDALKSIPLITEVEWINKDKYDFSRELQFTLRENTYKIVWYINVSNLLINDEIIIPFDSLEYNGFYPNHFKNNLVFSNKGIDVLYMPVEEYREVIK